MIHLVFFLQIINSYSFATFNVNNFVIIAFGPRIQCTLYFDVLVLNKLLITCIKQIINPFFYCCL